MTEHDDASMIKWALPLALLLACRPAAAQLMGPLWETNVTLTRADLDTIRATLAAKIHGRPAGTSAAWSDPASGNSGTITLVEGLRTPGATLRADRIPQLPARHVAARRHLCLDQLSAAGRQLEAGLSGAAPPPPPAAHAGRFQPSQSPIASPITSSRSRPSSHGSSSVNIVTHCR